MPVTYDGVRIDGGYRIDLLVADCVVVEVKAVKKILQIHEAELLTDLRLSQCPLGLLLNFNVPVLKEGITRLVNGFPDLCATSASSASQRWKNWPRGAAPPARVFGQTLPAMAFAGQLKIVNSRLNALDRRPFELK
jgi:hypothetical protein